MTNFFMCLQPFFKYLRLLSLNLEKNKLSNFTNWNYNKINSKSNTLLDDNKKCPNAANMRIHQINIVLTYQLAIRKDFLL